MPSENRTKYLMESTGTGYTAYVVDTEVYQTSTAEPLPEGVSRWTLDGHANDVWDGNDGTVNGATFVTADERSAVDQALDFDGTDDYVGGIGEPAELHTDTFTHALWVRTTAHGSSNGVTYCVERGRVNSSKYNNMQVSEGVGRSVLTFDDDTQSILLGTTPINDGDWHHVARTYDQSTHRLYVDGVEEAAENASKSVGYYEGQGVEIGRRGGGNYYNGELSDVRHYDQALTAEQIDSLAAT